MDIKCTPQPAVTGNSSELIWWLTNTTEKTPISINNFKDKIVVSNLPANITAEVKTVVVHNEADGEDSTTLWPPDHNHPNVYQPNLKDHPPSQVNRIVICLKIKLSENALKCTVNLSATINNQAAKIDGKDSVPLNIDLPASTPEIRAFRAVPSLVSINTPFALEWIGRNACSWRLDDKDLGGLTGTDVDKAEGWKSYRVDRDPVSKGTHEYHLVASAAGVAKAEAKTHVRAKDTALWRNSYEPWGQTRGLRGICVGVDFDTKAEKLYAVVLSPPDSASPDRTEPVGKLWSSDDGLSWTSLGVKIPRKFVTSPVVAVPSADWKKPKPTLVFAGGSKIDYDTKTEGNFSNEIYLLDLNAPETPKTEERAEWWKPRAGHACLLGEDQDKVKKLWIIGGLSESGNALDDAYVLENLEPQGKWVRREFPGWPRCYHFAAAVKPHGKRRAPAGPEFWLLGGFTDTYDGRPYGQVHVFQTDGPIKSLTHDEVIPEAKDSQGKELRTSGVALVALHDRMWGICTRVRPDDLRSGVACFRPLEEWADEVKIDRLEQTDSLTAPALGDTVKHKRIEAVAFNGCIWVFALYLKEDRHSEIGVSKLQYWIADTDQATKTGSR